MDHLERSVELARSGRLADAVEEARKQISIYPQEGYLNFWLGTLLYDMHEYEMAVEAFKRELIITPWFRDAAWEMGSAYSRLGRGDDVIQSYHLALDIDPCCGQALFGLGNACLRQDKDQEAIEYYKDILILLPELDQSDIRANESNRKEFVVQVQYNLGIAMMRSNDRENAKTAFETVLRLEPKGRLAKIVRHYLSWLADPNISLESIKLRTTELSRENL